jgi:SAM-dependent methyltransferase
MDATNTTFDNNTFDMAFDKGTLDALMCAKNLEIPYNLIREMYRVTKPQKYFIVVTYGRPDERLKIFLEALKDDTLYKYSYEVKEINLSLMSNLINILRNKSDNFSVSNAIKDKKILVPSVVEACIGKLILEKEKVKGDIGLTQEEIQIKLDLINKKILNMKVLKMLYNKKFEKEDKAEKVNEVQKEEQGQSEQMDPDLLNVEKNLKEAKNLIEDSNTQNSNESNPTQNNARRNHCYMYIFKKL